MSSRALRRLERLRQSQTPETGDSDDEDTGPVSKPAVNAFAFLGEDSESNDEEEQTVEPEKPVKPEEPEEPVVPVPLNKSKKKKKRGKKKSAKSSGEDHGSDQNDNDDDDLDRFLAEVRKKDLEKSTPVPEASFLDDTDVDGSFEQPFDEAETPIAYSDSNYLYFTTARLKQSLPLLSVGSVKNLDADNELKNLFGNLSLDTIDDANSTTSLSILPEMLAAFKKMARLTRGWGGRDRRSIPGTARKLLLTRVRDDYLPTSQKPLEMQEYTKEDLLEVLRYKEDQEGYDFLQQKLKAEQKLGVHAFKFQKIPSVADRVANSRFYAAVVMTPDPDALMQLLQQNPYHVETLQQVAMVFLRQGNNKSTSNALVEKCLFVFDRSFNKRFHELLQDGKSELVRLPYESFMNRQFYLCLFRTIFGLSEGSTFFTALSYCKFLLGLSPAEDPLGVRYFIDHYAILSEEFDWLVRFAQSPLVSTYREWYTPGIAFSEVLALLHKGHHDAAREALRKAYSCHPYCAYHLLAQVGLASLIPLSEGDIHKDDAIALASETYLVRAPLLWKDQTHRQFLHDELSVMMKESKRSGKSWFGKLFGAKTDDTATSIPVSLIRFALLSGENRVLSKMPEKIFDRDDVLEYDVMPPKDNSAGYDVFRGVESTTAATDSLFDYLDHNIISAIVQNRTGAEFEDLMATLDHQEMAALDDQNIEAQEHPE